MSDLEYMMINVKLTLLKTWSIALSVCCLLFFSNRETFAQASTPKSPETDFQLPPLDEIIELAIQYSPALKQQEQIIHKADQQLMVQKKSWTSGISLGTSYSAGNQSLLVQQATGNLEAFSNYNNGYRLSLGAAFSINTIITQKNITKIAKADKQIAIESKQLTIDQIKNDVIAKYYAVAGAHEALKIAIEMKTSSLVNKKMAEREFSEGQINVADMAKILESTSSAAVGYENAKQTFIMNVRLLEVLIGKRLF
ncbi:MULTISPECIES: TolC family protein [Flectobacillus]|uniref:TolC family protein n=1 Tax=Flectobacillus rivi TaxID=2984209 RepID=A0ABT6Z2U4_9BACT|nr:MULTISPECIES: TolC family protein [Flectobacillus]MDI9869409.1 TolC family protein [Flectobacillus roseus]MDI9875450.1 TolC family protein [Flectobacillus rivi]